MKKRIGALVLAIFLLLGILTSCGGYAAVDSTEEELATVLTFKLGEQEYKVPYELYRALFLTHKSDVDNGDASVWSGEEKQKYIDEINGIIISRLADIYAIFSIAKEIGIDVYSKEYDEKVEEYVKAGVDGGIVDSVIYEGFDGDYDKYLDSLRDMYLNYSVSDLLYRYSMAVDDIYYYYGGNVENDAIAGKLEYTKDDVWEFYYSDSTRRVMRLFLSTVTASFTEERALQIRDTIAKSENENEALTAMINYSTLGASDLSDGIIIAEYNLDSLYYSSLTEEALSLSIHETSQPVKVVTGFNNGFFILFCMEKNDEHFDKCYDDIAASYVENEIGRIISKRATDLMAGTEYSSLFDGLSYADIKMDKVNEQ